MQPCMPAFLSVLQCINFQGCMQETRRAYRELFMTADIGQAYAGAHYAWCSSIAQQRVLQILQAKDKCSKLHPSCLQRVHMHCTARYLPAAVTF